MESENKKEKDIRSIALRKLAHRGRTKKELRDILLKEEFSLGEIEPLIEELESLGYLNDAGYAMSYLEFSEGKGWARARGIRELKKRGLSEADIELALLKLEEDKPFREGANSAFFDEEKSEEERALSVGIKMVKEDDLDERGRLPEKVKSRIARRLFSYGYNSDTIYSTLRKIEEKLNY